GALAGARRLGVGDRGDLIRAFEVSGEDELELRRRGWGRRGCGRDGRGRGRGDGGGPAGAQHEHPGSETSKKTHRHLLRVQPQYGVGSILDEDPSRPISRIPSWTVISLGRRSPSASSGAPGDGAGHAIAPIHRLAPGRACLVSPACADRHCGAGPRLAADGCYPLPCPVESGLSSTAFAAATVWPARTAILTAACLAQQRVDPLRRAYERVVGGSAVLGDVRFDDTVRVARATPFAQVARKTDRVEETAAQMRRRPAHQDDATFRP